MEVDATVRSELCQRISIIWAFKSYVLIVNALLDIVLDITADGWKVAGIVRLAKAFRAPKHSERGALSPGVA